MGEEECSGVVTPADVYLAECEACKAQALAEEAENEAKRRRLEFNAAVWRVRELARALGERGMVSPVAESSPVPASRDLFTEAKES
jgi:hypothetical protein